MKVLTWPRGALEAPVFGQPKGMLGALWGVELLHPDAGASGIRGSKDHFDSSGEPWVKCVSCRLCKHSNQILMSSRACQMATRTVGDVVSVSPPPYFYLLLMPQGRTECEMLGKLCYNSKSLLYRFAPSLTWSFRALFRCHLLSAAFLEQYQSIPQHFLSLPSVVFSSLAFTLWNPVEFRYSFRFEFYISLSPNRK